MNSTPNPDLLADEKTLVSTPGSASEQAPEHASADPSETAPHVLIVDDDEELCELLSLRVEAKGYRVSSKHSVKAALDHIGREHIDAMLLDLRLGDGDGIDPVEAHDLGGGVGAGGGHERRTRRRSRPMAKSSTTPVRASASTTTLASRPPSRTPETSWMPRRSHHTDSLLRP